MQSKEDVEVGVDGVADFVGGDVLVGGVRAGAVAGAAFDGRPGHESARSLRVGEP